MKFILCDDDILFQKNFKNQILAACSKRNIMPEIVCHTNPKELMNQKDDQADVYFLDIEMPQMDGIDLAAFLKRQQAAEFIFVSAYEKYVWNAMKVKPIAFVRKDQLEQDLERALQEVLQEIAEKKHKILLMDGKKQVVLNLREMVYLSSAKDYVEIYFFDGNYLVIRQKLADVEKELEAYQFLRIHNRYLINLRYLVRMEERKQVLLSTGKRLPISKAYYQNVEDTLLRWFRRSDT